MTERMTESSSPHRNLETWSVKELLEGINDEDRKVADVIRNAIPSIEPLVNAVVRCFTDGGRLFYIGAGTSGRLAVVDASEWVPTFGTDPEMVTAIIAGGEKAITRAVEFAEDDIEQGWKDLQQHHVQKGDFVLGISASGSAPYVIAALKKCKEHGIFTGSLSCNSPAAISALADFPVEVPTGPEFITGSTRMKSGTAQKMVLNMISTAVMIRMGRVEDNKMVNMQLSNEKLIDRGTRMLQERLSIRDYDEARKLLLKSGSVKAAISEYGI